MPNLFLGFPVSRAKFAEVAAQALAAQLPFDGFYYRTFFDSLDGINQDTYNGGTITLTDSYVYLNVTTTSASRAAIEKNPNYSPVPMTWDKDRVWKAEVYLNSDTDSTMKFYIGMGDIVSLRGVSFKVEGGKLYARSKDGAGETNTEIEDWGLAGYSLSRKLKIVFTAGVKAEYYVDDVLVATINTNLPSGTSGAKHYFQMRAIQNSGTDSGYLLASYVEAYQKA